MVLFKKKFIFKNYKISFQIFEIIIRTGADEAFTGNVEI